MKKIIAVFTLLLCFQTQAGLIEVATSDNLLAVGESTTVTLTGSGFTSLNSLSFVFGFDTSVFAYSGSLMLDVPGLPPLATEVAAGVSFGLILFPAVTDFVLSFDLSVIGFGDGSLGLSDIVAGNQTVNVDGSAAQPIIENASGSGASIGVNAPSAFATLILAGLFMLVRRRA